MICDEASCAVTRACCRVLLFIAYGHAQDTMQATLIKLQGKVIKLATQATPFVKSLQSTS